VVTPQYRTESLETWQRVAPAWERRNEQQWQATEPVSRDLVERLALRGGETVLELAAGLGQTGLLAAAAVGSKGRLVSSDFSPAMLDAARRLSARLGARNVEHRLVDAEEIDLPDASVDAVVCRWGFMLVADPQRAFRETRRVLRQGGRLAFAVWAPPDTNPWTAIFGRTLVAHGLLPPPEPGAPGMFALAHEKRLRELVTGAGFAAVVIVDVPLAFEYDSFNEYWSTMIELSRAAGAAIAALAEEDREAIRAEIESGTAPYRANGGYRLPGLSRNVLAT
jgi:ubiquinone/menaquinone biosynthesis C-methylase UbiE